MQLEIVMERCSLCVALNKRALDLIVWSKASIRSGAQEVRLARVRDFTFPASRKDSRSRMAGGEERLGTRAI